MSEDILKKITLEINKHESLEDKELNIIRFQLLKKSNILKVILRGKERLAIEEEELIPNTMTSLPAICILRGVNLIFVGICTSSIRFPPSISILSKQ